MITGQIACAGDYEGEWRVVRDEGGEITCLGENLIVLGETGANATT